MRELWNVRTARNRWGLCHTLQGPSFHPSPPAGVLPRNRDPSPLRSHCQEGLCQWLWVWKCVIVPSFWKDALSLGLAPGEHMFLSRISMIPFHCLWLLMVRLRSYLSTNFSLFWRQLFPFGYFRVFSCACYSVLSKNESSCIYISFAWYTFTFLTNAWTVSFNISFQVLYLSVHFLSLSGMLKTCAGFVSSKSLTGISLISWKEILLCNSLDHFLWPFSLFTVFSGISYWLLKTFIDLFWSLLFSFQEVLFGSLIKFSIVP